MTYLNVGLMLGDLVPREDSHYKLIYATLLIPPENIYPKEKSMIG